ncbi:MAG: RNA polymerase sigma factor [Vicinamibacterales bacterium]
MAAGHRLSVVTVAELTLRRLGAPAMSDAAGPATVESETARLVTLARAGDAHAFGTLVDQHVRSARRVAAAALAAPDDADDVVQEACLTAWQRLGELADPHAFRSWLLRITWRKALDRRRSVRRWLTRLVSGDAASDEIDVTVAPGPTPEGEAMAGELDRALTIAIRSLPTRLRDPFLLATAQHHRYDEIAACLGLPVGTVKWRVFEARRILRAKVAALGHEVADV